ncbi:MAG TPA: hypothetical protein VFK08_03835, partial [Rhodanobacteraceae bacterium]|nr:hypothetical protein [Rhodanobacteraceae bacterium]
GANSHIPVLRQSRLSRASGCDARRHATAPKLAQHGHPWPASSLTETPRTKKAPEDSVRQTHTVNFFCEKNKTCAGEFLR